MNDNRSEIISDVNVVLQRVPELPEERIQEATAAAAVYPFRTTRFYVEQVLNGRPDDPLLDVILPIKLIIRAIKHFPELDKVECRGRDGR